MIVRVQAEDFVLARELDRLRLGRQDIGALVSFTGIVRGDDGLCALELEHYPAMTQTALEAIATDAMRRWNLSEALIIHRFGKLLVGDQIMMVATACAHRRAAFEAADYMMDYLKSRAPFWKKEHKPGQAASWVAARQSDEADLNRW